MTTALIRRAAALLGAIVLSSGSALFPAVAAADAMLEDLGGGALGWPNHGVWKVTVAPPGNNHPSVCSIYPLGVGGALSSSTPKWPVLSVVYSHLVVRFLITDTKVEPKIMTNLSLNIGGKMFGPYKADFLLTPDPSFPPGIGAGIPVQEQRDVFAALKSAASLEVITENASWRFDPKGMDGAVDDLFNCVAHYIN